MVTLLSRHQVRDFELWQAVFNGHQANREHHGATGHRILRNGDDVVVLTDFPDATHVQRFLTDPALQAVISNAGFLAPPISVVLNPVIAVAYC